MASIGALMGAAVGRWEPVDSKVMTGRVHFKRLMQKKKKRKTVEKNGNFVFVIKKCHIVLEKVFAPPLSHFQMSCYS